MPACENGAPQRTAPSLMRNLAGDAVGRVDDEIGARRTAPAGCRASRRCGVRLDPQRAGSARRRRRGGRRRPCGVRSPRCGAASWRCRLESSTRSGSSSTSVPTPAAASVPGRRAAERPDADDQHSRRRPARAASPFASFSLVVIRVQNEKASAPRGTEAKRLSLSPYLPGRRFLPAGISTSFPVAPGTVAVASKGQSLSHSG